jgi:hypothetical protein
MTMANDLTTQYVALARRIARDRLALIAVRYGWKTTAVVLSVVAIAAPILVASGFFEAGSLLGKILLFSATAASALFAFFKPGALAFERRLDYARMSSLANGLALEWGRAAEHGAKERWEVLVKFGASFDEMFEERAGRLLEGKVLRGELPGAEAGAGADPKSPIHVVND